MFKRYGAKHWGLFIPIGFKRSKRVWDTARDIFVIGYFRRCLCFTVKSETFCGNFVELRVRAGVQFL
jgi:hypothetical protein